jgi:hypothetical protein
MLAMLAFGRGLLWFGSCYYFHKTRDETLCRENDTGTKAGSGTSGGFGGDTMISTLNFSFSLWTYLLLMYVIG